MVDQILGKYEGVIKITDDILMHGGTDKEHGRRLHKFMRVAKEWGECLPFKA